MAWAPSSGAELHSPGLTHSEPPKVMSPVMTAFTMEATSLYSSTSGYPKSAGNGQESVSSHSRGLQETSRCQDASSATDTSVVFPQASRAAPTRVTGSEFTSSDGISGPDFTQSMGNTNILNHPFSPSMAGSSHTTFRTPTSPSGAIPERTLNSEHHTPSLQGRETLS